MPNTDVPRKNLPNSFSVEITINLRTCLFSSNNNPEKLIAEFCLVLKREESKAKILKPTVPENIL